MKDSAALEEPITLGSNEDEINLIAVCVTVFRLFLFTLCLVRLVGVLSGTIGLRLGLVSRPTLCSCRLWLIFRFAVGLFYIVVLQDLYNFR